MISVTPGGILVIDPTGQKDGSRRVNRSGNWDYDGFFCQAAYRFWSAPAVRYDFLGLRPVTVIQLRK